MPKTLPTPAAKGDLGLADPTLAAAVAAGDERALLEALAGARVFVGVEPRRSHPEHEPEGRATTAPRSDASNNHRDPNNHDRHGDVDGRDGGHDPAGTSATRAEAREHRAEAGDGRADDAEMALVILQVPSGASAVPAFTSVAALAEWRSAARPVAVTGAALAAEAVRLGHSALVIDLGQPAYATVDGQDLARLAEMRPVSAE
jgi:hypothetical protein